MSVSNPHAIQNFVSEGARGNFSLPDAFFRYYLSGRIVVFVICALLHHWLGFLGWFLASIIWMAYWLWSLFVLWRCAHNTELATLFYVARALVIVDALYAFSNPPLFAFVD